MVISRVKKVLAHKAGVDRATATQILPPALESPDKVRRAAGVSPLILLKFKNQWAYAHRLGPKAARGPEGFLVDPRSRASRQCVPKRSLGTRVTYSREPLVLAGSLSFPSSAWERAAEKLCFEDHSTHSTRTACLVLFTGNSSINGFALLLQQSSLRGEVQVGGILDFVPQRVNVSFLRARRI
jgi:hypothetical protein